MDFRWKKKTNRSDDSSRIADDFDCISRNHSTSLPGLGKWTGRDSGQHRHTWVAFFGGWLRKAESWRIGARNRGGKSGGRFFRKTDIGKIITGAGSRVNNFLVSFVSDILTLTSPISLIIFQPFFGKGRPPDNVVLQRKMVAETVRCLNFRHGKISGSHLNTGVRLGTGISEREH